MKKYDVYIEPATRHNCVAYLMRDSTGHLWEPLVFIPRPTANPDVEIGLRTAQKKRRAFIDYLKAGGMSIKETRTLTEHTTEHFESKLEPVLGIKVLGWSSLDDILDRYEFFFFSESPRADGRRFLTKDEVYDLPIWQIRQAINLPLKGLYPARLRDGLA